MTVTVARSRRGPHRGPRAPTLTAFENVMIACDRIVRMRDGLVRQPSVATPPVEPRMVERRELVGSPG
jgi:hypothetical protein